MIVVSIGVAFALTRIFGYKDGESQPQTVSGNETVQEVPVINETVQENANVVVKHFCLSSAPDMGFGSCCSCEGVHGCM